MKKIFNVLVIVSITLYAVWYFMPYAWVYLYDSQSLDLMGWTGFGAIIDIYGPIGYVLGLVYLISLFGLLFFKAWSRTLFTIMTVVNILISPFTGVVIQGGYDVMIGSILGLANGAIIALMYLTSLSHEFRKV
ncbi:hypothetical protein [Bermanella sp. R86510]|uniref:hypothetical protein n=1 Tax=unclassified Bermanella TaxID=2627862 RepID=UPI0037C6DBBB